MDITTNTNRLSTCFLSDEPFEKQLNKWEHEVKTHIIRAFPKIRSKKRKFSDTETGRLFEERKRIKLSVKENPTDQNHLKLAEIDEKIANKIAEKYKSEIFETMGHLTAEDGGISHHGVWKAKSSIIPSEKSNVPVALKAKWGI